MPNKRHYSTGVLFCKTLFCVGQKIVYRGRGKKAIPKLPSICYYYPKRTRNGLGNKTERVVSITEDSTLALYSIETEAGIIKIRSAVIGRIIMEAVRKFQGRVKITNQKGKVIRTKEKNGIMDATDYFDISMNEKGLDIRIYIAIRFGTSIGMVTEQLIRDIKNDIEALTGLEANSIAIIVTGLISKQIAPRNIQVKG